MDRKRNVTPKYPYILVLGLIAAMTAGCGLRDTVVDGFFGGVGDTISTVVSDTLLGLLER